eukprot:9284447-Pyramimonas_sp.AAC.1
MTHQYRLGACLQSGSKRLVARQALCDCELLDGAVPAFFAAEASDFHPAFDVSPAKARTYASWSGRPRRARCSTLGRARRVAANEGGGALRDL